MMKVAVDKSLQNVKKALKENGFQVTDVTDNVSADAYVVSGMQTNMLNMQESQTKAPVIDANGLTTEEIVFRLNELQ